MVFEYGVCLFHIFYCVWRSQFRLELNDRLLISCYISFVPQGTCAVLYMWGRPEYCVYQDSIVVLDPNHTSKSGGDNNCGFVERGKTG